MLRHRKASAGSASQRLLWCLRTVESLRTKTHHFSIAESGVAKRTTFALDDAAAALAQTYAKARSLRLGQAVSELIRLANAPPVSMRQRGQVWVFELPADTPVVTAQQVKALRDEAP